MPSIDSGLYQRDDCKGFEQITSLASAKSLTPSPGATEAEIQIEGGSARFRPDNVTPTAAIGVLCSDGDILLFNKGQDLTKIKFIQVSGTLVLNCCYY